MAFSLLSLFAKAEPLKQGDPAPVLSAITDSGATLDLGQVYQNSKYTLVYFYPKADTPGCTKQGCSLRDAYAELTAKGISVIGVSVDGIADQKAFRDKFKFPFPLIADKDKKVVNAFKVPTMAALGLAKRQAYLIKDGKILWADHSASTDKQAEDVLKIVTSDR